MVYWRLDETYTFVYLTNAFWHSAIFKSCLVILSQHSIKSILYGYWSKFCMYSGTSPEICSLANVIMWHTGCLLSLRWLEIVSLVEQVSSSTPATQQNLLMIPCLWHGLVTFPARILVLKKTQTWKYVWRFRSPISSNLLTHSSHRNPYTCHFPVLLQHQNSVTLDQTWPCKIYLCFSLWPE